MTDESTSNGECTMTLEERMTCLEQANRRLRFTVAGLAALIGLSFVAGMTAAAPDELTLRKLSIVDGTGTRRIVMDGALPDGRAGTTHYDKDGKVRIATSTLPDGAAGTVHYDKDGNRRITTTTSPIGGLASTSHYDKDGNQRIVTATLPDGHPSTAHYDKEIRQTVYIGVAVDGTGMISVHDPTGRERSSQLITRP